MYYYAILDDHGVATSKTSSSTQITDIHYITITAAQYNSFDTTIKNKSWNAYTKTFVERIYWSCSSSEVHENSENLGLALSDRITMIREDVDTSIKTVNQQFTMTSNYGTFSGTCPIQLKENAVYLVSINYTNNNALADRTLYVLRTTSTRLQTTTMLVGGNNGNDSLVVANSNGTFTFSSSYTGTANGATVKII